MKLHIDHVATSKSGKSLNVKCGQKFYLAKLDSKLDLAVGKDIDAEVEESEYNGATLTWINKWAAYKDEPAAAPPRANDSPAPKNGSDVMRFMPFVSNVCAHAIAVGKCESPHMISAWAKAAYEAALALETIAEFRQEME